MGKIDEMIESITSRGGTGIKKKKTQRQLLEVLDNSKRECHKSAGEPPKRESPASNML